MRQHNGLKAIAKRNEKQLVVVSGTYKGELVNHKFFVRRRKGYEDSWVGREGLKWLILLIQGIAKFHEKAVAIGIQGLR